MNYYNIGISKFPFIAWLIIAMVFTFFSAGKLFLILIVPLCFYFVLKNCRYYYNDEKMVIEKGVFNKKQFIVPLYRITNITAQDNIFNYGTIYIRDKGQTIVLKYVDHSKKEMLTLTEKWENAKKQNIRNEVI